MNKEQQNKWAMKNLFFEKSDLKKGRENYFFDRHIGWFVF